MVLEMFCLNRDAWPSSRQALYKIGPLVKDARFERLIRLVDGKEISSASARQTVQEAVWEVSEEGRLRETQEDLEKLPDRRL